MASSSAVPPTPADEEAGAAEALAPWRLRRPGQQSRSCTDIAWVFIFLAALAAFAGVGWYAATHGDVRRLTHGADYRGRTCGVDVPGEFVFWCRKANMTIPGLDLRYPICIDSCPTGPETSRECYDGEHGVMTMRKDYRSYPAGAYCIPGRINIKNFLIRQLAGSSSVGRVNRTLVTLYNGVVPLVLALGVAALIGGAYLLLIGRYTKLVMYLGLCPFFGVPMVVGRDLIHQAYQGYHDGIEGDDYRPRHIIVGCLLVLFGAFSFAFALALAKRLRSSVGHIRATCECLLQEPSLLLQPFLDLSLRIGLLAGVARGLALLVSCGTVGELGLRKRFEHTEMPYFCIAYYLFMVLWLFEVCTALSQYSLAWVTQTWYFAPYEHGAKVGVPRLGILHAWRSALRYHLGTVIFGALVIMLFRLPRLLFARLASCRRGGSSGLLARLRSLKKDAYMDVALNSSGFCAAASSSFDVASKHHNTIVMISLSQWLFVFIGYAVITSAGVFSSLVLVRSISLYTDSDSALYIEEPGLLAAAAGVASFGIAVSWMTVFDTVGDTILYCFSMDQGRKEQRRQALAELAREQRPPEDGEDASSSWIGWLVGNGLRCVFPMGDADDDRRREEEECYTPRSLRQVLSTHTAKTMLLRSGW